MSPTELAKHICELTAEQIRQRIADLRAEEAALKALYRSAVIRERAAGKRQEVQHQHADD